MGILDVKGLKLVIIPCREPVPVEALKFYNSAYQLWHRVWSETLKELDGVEKLFSNEFTRHDFAVVLFSNDTAISLACYSSVNLKLDSRLNDAWFESWPQEILIKQKERDGEGVLAAWFCAAPEYRKTYINSSINIAKLMVEAFGRVVLDGAYSVGYGVSRNNRGVNKMLYEIGGTKLGESVAHGCAVDLILIEPENVHLNQLSYSNIFKKLWENKIDFRVRDYEQKLSRAA